MIIRIVRWIWPNPKRNLGYTGRHSIGYLLMTASEEALCEYARFAVSL